MARAGFVIWAMEGHQLSNAFSLHKNISYKSRNKLENLRHVQEVLVIYKLCYIKTAIEIALCDTTNNY